MNKKGFMFVETIVTLTVLMTALLLLYNVFVNLLRREKTVTNYNKESYVYALYYIKEDLLNEDLSNEDEDKYLKLQYPDVVKDITNKLKDDLKFRYEKIYDLKTLIVQRCDSTTRPKDSDLSKEFEEFIDTIGTCEKNVKNWDSSLNNSVVKILGEFYDKKQDKYYYAYILYPNIKVK